MRGVTVSYYVGRVIRVEHYSIDPRRDLVNVRQPDGTIVTCLRLQVIEPREARPVIRRRERPTVKVPAISMAALVGVAS
jgi:hypothetical protein